MKKLKLLSIRQSLADDEVVGYVFGEVRKGKAGPAIPLEEPYLEIFEVYVHPDYRSQGLGKKLIFEMVKKAESNQVHRWRETAAFYEALGFNMWYIQMFK
jgi:GNAT superfamily N-acetyltransferase